MRMIIMGGGRTGQNLARVLLNARNEVGLIEKDLSRCRALADALDATVFRGDGSNVSVLEAAGARDADCFMAVTGVDQDNLVASQLARDYFHVKKVIARVNDPGNLDTFRLLGLENLVCSAEILTRMIEQEADSRAHLIATLDRGRADISSVTLPENSALDGVTVGRLRLPEGALLIAVIRQGALTVPGGATVLHSGDEVVALAAERVRKAVMKALSATKEANP